MRRRKKTPYVITFFIALLVFGFIGFATGYYVYQNRLADPPDISLEDPNNNPLYKDPPDVNNPDHDPENETPVTRNELSIGSTTRVVFRTLYTSCQSIRDNVMEPLNEMIGLRESSFKDYVKDNLSEWQVVRFSTDEVVLFRRLDQICPDHFFVTELEGYIAVFRFSEDGEKILIEKTSIPISVLPAIDQDKLKRGIILKDRDEVNRLLEDYSG
ncbi:BofC C-terminal domain-containing protein [Alkaliphilus serpentinus]|uniref:Bypass of forespore C C-terminal domain-containing protein n=1 Tax=Alkaliphilus serpentinus TaxID=1482731 RepID=A0A833M9H0_9FIRM|nr:BofC C-terminal domain-containing protein [Alkaliphilus serpentinus]KAB3527684.1 hypothetical protein F8153_11935 [Alkaliphilus serpentinus]